MPEQGGHAVSRFHPSATAALGAAAAIVLLAGCAELQNAMDDTLAGSGDRGARTVAYECDDDQDFSARFSGDRDEVSVRTDDETYDLELVSNRDGRRVYSDDDDAGDSDVRLTLGENGRRARLDIPREDAFAQCDANL
jgi:membrane-bound inhibitor of C-type lysozyme